MTSSAYDHADYARAYPIGYERHFWHQARLRIVTAALERVAIAGPVLDVGCGPGRYVHALVRRGYDAFGCDPGDVPVSDDLAGRVFARTDVNALPETVRDRIEAVLLLDVLEHLADPEALLGRLRELLPRLRAMVVTVPARPELWSVLDEHAGHVRRYRAADLSTLVMRAGYDVVDVRYLFRALYLPAWIGRRAARQRTVTAPAHPRIHAIVGRMLAVEAGALPAGLPGTSLLCVARSPSD